MKPETKQKLKKIFPPLGMRIVKTALSLFVALVLSDFVFKLFLKDLDTNSVCVFAVLSVQDSVKGTRKFIFERFLGNILGLAMGFLFLFLFTLTGTTGTNGHIINGNFVFYAFVAVGALATIYLCKMMRRVSASVITILVFLGIMFAAAGEMNRYLKGAYTVMQMTIGIIIAVAINLLILPPKAPKENNLPPDEKTAEDIDAITHDEALDKTLSDEKPQEKTRGGESNDDGLILDSIDEQIK